MNRRKFMLCDPVSIESDRTSALPRVNYR